MIRYSLTALIALSLCATAPAGFARGKVSVAQAERICQQRASRFAQTPYGRDAGGPAPNQIKDRYRACVYAKSGYYPRNRLNIRGISVTVTPRLN